MEGWLSRTEMLLGPEALQKLKESHVLVAGLGGVGSWAAEMICRAGVGAMTIIDGDVVTAANRNRQLPALTSTTGRRKAEVMGERLLDINPELRLRIIPEFIRDQRMIDIPWHMLGIKNELLANTKLLLPPRRADLYLLCAPDLPWQADGQRDRGDRREEMHRLFSEALAALGARVELVRGEGEAREASAAEWVARALSERRARGREGEA